MECKKTWSSAYWRKTDSESETEEETLSNEKDSIKTATNIDTEKTEKAMSSKKDDGPNDDTLSCTFSTDEEENDNFKPVALNLDIAVNEPSMSSRASEIDPRCNDAWTESKLAEIRQIEQEIRLRLTALILIPSERASIVMSAQDPRQAAEPPVINRRWETSVKGKVPAVRGNTKAKGDILTPILNSMTYINYPNLSFYTQGAQIKPVPSTITTTTSTATTAKKKPKGSRNVPPAAKNTKTKAAPKKNAKQQPVTRRRRKAPINREIIPTSSDDEQEDAKGSNKEKTNINGTTAKSTKKKKERVLPTKRTEDSSDVVSDESWPTDKEEGAITNIPEVEGETETLDPLAQAVFQAGILLISTPEVYDPECDIEYDPANITYQPSLDTLDPMDNEQILTPPPSNAEAAKPYTGIKCTSKKEIGCNGTLTPKRTRP